MGVILYKKQLYSGGSDVEPNPEDEPTGMLKTLKIEDTTYELAGSGGESTYGVFVDTNRVIVQTTTFETSFSYTATEDCYISIYLLQSQGSSSISIDGEIVHYGYTQDLDGMSSGYYLKKGQVASATTVNTSGYPSSYIVYGIQNGSNPIYAPVIYSSEEREIGVWTDGKPLYQKVIEFSSPITIGTGWTRTGYSIDDADSIAWAEARYMKTTIRSMIQIDLYDNTEEICMASPQNSYFVDAVLVQYTKTTDVPGSGSYTELGIPAIHYDNSERVIGTWFDKPLYSRAYSITATSAWTSGSNKIATLDATWTITRIDSVVKENNAQYSMPYVNGMGSIRLEVDNGTDLNMVVNGTSYAAGSVAQIIIEYTKTTD